MRSPSAEKSEGLPSRKTSLPTTRKVTTIGVRLLGVFLAAGFPITKPKSDSVFTAITLVVAICTEVNALGHFERDEPIEYLWGVLTGYSGEAQALYRRRYAALLSE